MKLKNAGIKSKKELATRMLSGEIFYYNDHKIYFDERELNPFRVCTLKPECIYDRLEGLWYFFAGFKIESRWEDELKNGPVLCWVDDDDPGAKNNTAHIVSEIMLDSAYFYKCKKEDAWVYATPIQPSECLNMEN